MENLRWTLILFSVLITQATGDGPDIRWPWEKENTVGTENGPKAESLMERYHIRECNDKENNTTNCYHGGTCLAVQKPYQLFCKCTCIDPEDAEYKCTRWSAASRCLEKHVIESMFVKEEGTDGPLLLGMAIVTAIVVVVLAIICGIIGACLGCRNKRKTDRKLKKLEEGQSDPDIEQISYVRAPEPHPKPTHDENDNTEPLMTNGHMDQRSNGSVPGYRDRRSPSPRDSSQPHSGPVTSQNASQSPEDDVDGIPGVTRYPAYNTANWDPYETWKNTLKYHNKSRKKGADNDATGAVSKEDTDPETVL